MTPVAGRQSNGHIFYSMRRVRNLAKRNPRGRPRRTPTTDKLVDRLNRSWYKTNVQYYRIDDARN